VARPKSEDKRNAILDAATRLFAERGLTAAPTSEISKQAGIAHPKQRKVLAQLQVSEVLTKESRDAGSAPFVEFQIMIRDAIEQRVFRKDLPVELISKSLAALVEATIDLTVSNPSKANKYRDSGFQMFWAGITK